MSTSTYPSSRFKPVVIKFKVHSIGRRRERVFGLPVIWFEVKTMELGLIGAFWIS